MPNHRRVARRLAKIAAELARLLAHVLEDDGPKIAGPRLSPSEKAILHVLRCADEPLSIEEVAPLAGYPVNSRFRGCFTRLKKLKKLIVASDDKYSIAEAEDDA